MLWLTMALAADPTVSLSWKARTQGTIQVVPPAGEHPGGGTISLLLTSGSLEIRHSGPELPAAIPLVPGPISLKLSLSFCKDDNSACRIVELEGQGVIAGRSGSLPLKAVLLETVSSPASQKGIRVLDFSAIWCPPCNLMAAEVLDDPEESVAIRSIPIEKIDVDRTESWEQKSRYRIGGYPTLVAVDEAGHEVDRLVGYPGEEATRAWLLSLGTGVSLTGLEAGSPEAFAVEERGSIARRLAEAGKTEAARRYLVGATETVDFHIARLLIEERPEDARWLFDNQAGYGDWIYTAVEVEPSLASRLGLYIESAPAEAAAGYLGLAAPEGEAGNSLRAAAIALIQSKLTGNIVEDRGWYTELADLYAQSGNWKKAVELLAVPKAAFPAEFTWPYASARILKDAEQWPLAEANAWLALGLAYGDQRLRAAKLLAEILHAEARTTEALQLIDAILTEMPEPPPTLQVRTSRYRNQLLELQATLQSPKK
jgi:thioredoxin 1